MDKTLDKGVAKGGRQYLRPGLVTVAIATLLGMSGGADAFEIPTGNEDIKVNWDNSIRYNLGYRVGKADEAILANPDLDDGDRNFRSGIVTNRLDLLSELDVSYQKKYGFRLSGAGWYDPAYSKGNLSKNLATSNAFDSNGNQIAINSYTKRYYLGPSGELLDAFLFGKFEIAEIPLQIKVGRNTQFWGEGLGFNAALNGISYAQMPIDVAKAYGVPNTGAKELFRPLNNITITTQPASTLTLMGQYFLEWEPNRYPEAGSYMAPYDYLFNGGIGSQQAFGGLVRGSDIKPKNVGDWGVGARWSPEALNGTTFGLYYRNFSDKMPQAHIDTDNGQLRFAYADNIHLYGLSYSQQILGVSVGAELSYRQNMPLLNTGAAVAATDLPSRGNVSTARGDTLHAVLNFLGLINRTPVFDAASYIVEFNWGNYLKVTEDPFGTFMGYESYTDINRATKDFVTVDLNFAPTWFQVFPGADLTLPLYYGRGLRGNSPTNILQKNAGSWSAGASIDYLARHKFDLLYVDYFGKYRTDPATGMVAVNNGDPALLKDRNTVSLTYRYSF